MIGQLNQGFWVLLFFGIIGLVVDPGRQWNGYFQVITIAIQLYFFLFSALVVFASWQRERIAAPESTLALRPSDKSITLIAQGVVLVLLFAFYLSQYAHLAHPAFVVLLILFLYYIMQILAFNKPLLSLYPNRLLYFDYYERHWQWGDIRQVWQEDDRLIISSRDEEVEFRLFPTGKRIKKHQSAQAQGLLDDDLSSENNIAEVIKTIQAHIGDARAEI